MKRCVVFCEREGLTGPELLSAARLLDPAMRLIALAEEGGECIPAAGACGADEVRTLPFREDACTQADHITKAVKALDPDVVLFPATVRGRFLSAWTAARLGTGLTADCTDLQRTEDGLLKQIRPAFGGNLTAEILCRTHRPQMASVRPGVFPRRELFPGRTVPVQPLPQTGEAEPRLRCLKRIVSDDQVGLQDAPVIVAGGKGIGGPRGFEKLSELARLLGGAVGATRSAVDAGWISYDHQIGQTGVTVHPALYIAFGISGMIQHLVGMSASKRVIAVNKDRNALIFRSADDGIVADWEETADEMIETIKRRKS